MSNNTTITVCEDGSCKYVISNEYILDENLKFPSVELETKFIDVFCKSPDFENALKTLKLQGKNSNMIIDDEYFYTDKNKFKYLLTIMKNSNYDDYTRVYNTVASYMIRYNKNLSKILIRDYEFLNKFCSYDVYVYNCTNNKLNIPPFTINIMKKYVNSATDKKYNLLYDKDYENFDEEFDNYMEEQNHKNINKYKIELIEQVKKHKLSNKFKKDMLLELMSVLLENST